MPSLPKDPIDQSAINPVTPADLPALQRLFLERFHHPLDTALWSWKYAENKGFALGSRNEAYELITHYGALTRAVSFHGTPIQALQMADVVASAKSISGVSRRPPIYLAVKTIAETYLGLGKPFLLAYGFPNRRAYAIFKHLGIYQKAGNIFELSLNLVTAASPSWVNRFNISCQRAERYTPQLERALNQLWARMAQALTAWIIPVKDGPFFLYRYFSHPQHTYLVFSIRQRFTRQTKGVFVLKKTSETHAELMDFVCPPDDTALLMACAVRAARHAGFEHLSCWASDPIKALLSPYFDAVEDIGVIIPTNNHTPSPPIEQIYQQWWLIGGDTDFK
jgi:hypothetical protein